MHNLLFCPTFINEYQRVIKSYPKSTSQIKETLFSLQQTPFVGDAYPGFSPFHIRKIRIGLKVYRLSKRNGLRFIYLVITDTSIIIPLHIYKKGEYKKEQDVLHRIKRNVKAIIQEKEKGLCRPNLED